MEKVTPASLHVCQSVLQNALENITLPPKRNQISAFSSLHSQKITSAIACKHVPDKPSVRLSEDTPEFKRTATFHHTSKRNSKQVAQSFKSSLSHFPSQKEDYFETVNIGLGLVPLNKIQFQSQMQQASDQQEAIEDKMRDAKVHQEIIRAQYNTAMREITKKTKKLTKVQGKSQTSKTAYDYDGSLIPSFKTELIRYPGHFLDLQVSVDENRQESLPFPMQKASKKYIKFNSKPDYLSGKKNELKITESPFLKEFDKVNWSEGVQPISNKESCRKILGYINNNPKNYRKKKFNLFTSSQAPRQMRLQQLENYRYGGKFASLSSMNQISQKSINSYKTILDKQDGLNGDRKIKILNSKALQFLIKDTDKEKNDNNQNPVSSKKSNFCPNFNNRFSNS